MIDDHKIAFHSALSHSLPTAAPKKILVIDIGGTHVKALCSGEENHRQFASGAMMTAAEMSSQVKKLTADWQYDAVSIGYPGAVMHGKPASEPRHLGGGWVGFDFPGAFDCPVTLINDAAMQAMGSYKGGKMLFLGLGTGLGSAMIAAGFVEPMELGHLPYKKKTYEDYIGKTGKKRLGKKDWEKAVHKIVDILTQGLEPDDVILGGGNASKLSNLPAHCRLGSNADAFTGGFRLWQNPGPFQGTSE